MNRYEFYTNLSKYGKKSLIHSKQYGPSSDTNAYVAKIDNLYGKGKHRYFYTQEEWEAYKKNKDYAEKSESEKAQSGREAAIKKSQENNVKEASTLQKAQSGREAAMKKSQENVKKAEEEENKKNKALYDEISNKDSDKYDFDKAVELVKNSPEGKKLKSELDAAIKEHWGKDEDFEYPIQMLEKYVLKDEEGNYTGSYAEIKEKYPGLAGMEAAWNMICDTKQKMLNSDLYERNTANKENAIKQGQKVTHDQIKDANLVSDDPAKVQSGVEMKKNDFINFLNNCDYKKTSYLSKEEKDKIIANYIDYLMSISDLRSKEEKDPNNGMPLISKEMSIEETMEYINLGRKTPIDDIKGGGNCTLCTLALDLRMRGYDVSAPNINDAKNAGYSNTRSSGSMDLWNGILDTLFNCDDDEYDMEPDTGYMTRLYKGDVKTLTDVNSEKLKSSVSKQTNTYGNLAVSWNDCDWAHSMFYKVDSKGNIEIYDAQTNQKVDIDEVMANSHDWWFTRTDNLEPNWEYIIAHNCTVYK